MGHQAGREGCDFNVFQQPAEILREALSQDNGSIDRIEIKFPSDMFEPNSPSPDPNRGKLLFTWLTCSTQFSLNSKFSAKKTTDF